MSSSTGRYYSRDYGWRWLEHEHVIRLSHKGDRVSMFICMCGAEHMGPDRIVNSMILAHRMEAFPSVRRRL